MSGISSNRGIYKKNQLHHPFSILHVDGEEALFFLKSGRKYNLIISDYHMPEMDSLEFLMKLRKLGSNVPFILLIGETSENFCKS